MNRSPRSGGVREGVRRDDRRRQPSVATARRGPRRGECKFSSRAPESDPRQAFFILSPAHFGPRGAESIGSPPAPASADRALARCCDRNRLFASSTPCFLLSAAPFLGERRGLRRRCRAFDPPPFRAERAVLIRSRLRIDTLAPAALFSPH